MKLCNLATAIKYNLVVHINIFVFIHLQISTIQEHNAYNITLYCIQFITYIHVAHIGLRFRRGEQGIRVFNLVVRHSVEARFCAVH